MQCYVGLDCFCLLHLASLSNVFLLPAPWSLSLWNYFNGLRLNAFLLNEHTLFAQLRHAIKMISVRIRDCLPWNECICNAEATPKHIVIYGTLYAPSFLVISGNHSTFHLWPVRTCTVLSWPIIILRSVSLQCNKSQAEKSKSARTLQTSEQMKGNSTPLNCTA